MGRFFTGLVKVLAGIMLLVLLALAVFSPAWAARTGDVKVKTFTPSAAISRGSYARASPPTSRPGSR